MPPSSLPVTIVPLDQCFVDDHPRWAELWRRLTNAPANPAPDYDAPDDSNRDEEIVA